MLYETPSLAAIHVIRGRLASSGHDYSYQDSVSRMEGRVGVGEKKGHVVETSFF